MKFQISCDAFSRLAYVAMQLEEANVNRDHLKAIHLEHQNGRTYAVATNGGIMAIEFLGETAEPNNYVNVTIADDLLDRVRAEIDKSATLDVSASDPNGFCIVQFSTGHMHFKDANIRGDWPKWMDIPIGAGKVKLTTLAVDAELIARLGYSSPTGRMIFPTAVEPNKPIIVRDTIDPNWLGLFLNLASVDGEAWPAATVPNWITEAQKPK